MVIYAVSYFNMALYDNHGFFAWIWDSDGAFLIREIPGETVGCLCVLRFGGSDRICAVFQHFCVGRTSGKSDSGGNLCGSSVFLPERPAKRPRENW